MQENICLRKRANGWDQFPGHTMVLNCAPIGLSTFPIGFPVGDFIEFSGKQLIE